MEKHEASQTSYSATGQESRFFSNFAFACMHIYFDIHSIDIVLLAAVLACKVPKKDGSIREAMTSDDVELVSHAQYIAIQTVKNRKIKGYGQHEVSF
jgi:hypothetical protein